MFFNTAIFVPIGELDFDWQRLREESMARIVSRFKSPVHKIIACLEKSRDGWKEKYAAVKQSLRRAENQNRAVEKSRDSWRERALKAEAEVRAEKNCQANRSK